MLSHAMDDGSFRPIVFVARTLSSAEEKHAQIDKEGLTIVLGVRHFHLYLLGRTFMIFTDHKPLLGPLHQEKRTPVMASARVHRWSLTLAAYKFGLEIRKCRCTKSTAKQ